MQVDDLTTIDPNLDLTQILPIHEKRTNAFFNHFVMNTVSFLNHFAQSCESRLMEFENKLQRIEASLLILESQLSSISGLNDEVCVKNQQVVELPEVPVIEETANESNSEAKIEEDQVCHVGPTATNDPRYQRFFKMLQFGVPAPAVKLKMQTEGLDPEILDNPTQIMR